jgi:hypothetical protein
MKKKKVMKKIPRSGPGAAETITISLTLSVEKIEKAFAGQRGRRMLETMHEMLHNLGIVAYSGTEVFSTRSKSRKSPR